MSETISKIKLNGTEYTLSDSTKVDTGTVNQLIEITAENNTSLNTANDKLTQLLNKVNSSNGIDTSDATALASQILLGKTAYVNGVKIEGTLDLSQLLPENIIDGTIVGTTMGIHVCDYENTEEVPLTLIARKPSAVVLMRAYDDLSQTSSSIDISGIKYSLDEGTTWKDYTFTSEIDNYEDNGETYQRTEYTGLTIVLQNIGDRVCFKNINNTLSVNTKNFIRFKMPGEGDIYAIGNVASMINFTDTIPDFGFYCLFHNCSGLFNTPKIYAKFIGDRGCGEMFDACSNLTKIMKEIPSLEIGNAAFHAMFRNCPSLINIELNLSSITKIGEEACARMFENDTNLKNANITLSSNAGNRYCYYRTFAECSSLISGPEISISNIANVDSICEEMYFNCSSLKTIKVHFNSWSESSNSTYNWVYGVNNNGMFYCSADLIEQYDVNHIPNGWNVIRY